MYDVIENHNFYSKPVIASFDTFYEAMSFVLRDRSIIVFEVDEDNEGCADYFTDKGVVGMIEPRSE